MPTPPTFITDRLWETRFVDEDGKPTRVFRDAFNKVGQQSANAAATVPQYQSGTHAFRLNNTVASKLPSGSIFYETDRTLYYINQGGVWTYLAGTMQATQSGIPSDLSTLTPADDGVLVFVTDFSHTLIWNHNLQLSGGTGWTWAPGERGSGEVVAFSVAGTPNLTPGWVAANGATKVQMLNPDGSISLVTVPNVAGSFFRI